ncbi:MAG: cytochrome c oxidase subunit I [Solirubrobacterales bacterium]
MSTTLNQPGMGRALLGAVLGAAFGFGLVVALRAISGLEIFMTEQTGYPHVVVPAITTGFGFLGGLGAFDYWFRWASGAVTIEEDHSGHGAESWRDYFKFNTDHKVIGIQYLVTTFFFFFCAGLMAMFMRAELAQPGTQVVDPGTFNGLFSVHAAMMIFVFIVPVFAGLANYVLPLMIGAPDMAFPRLNALSFWMLPIAGLLFLTSYVVPGGAFDAGWTGYAPLSTGAPLGQSFFNLGVQFAGASSVATALNFLVTIITMRAPGMNFWRMPLLVWANFATSLLVVAATPFVAGAQFMVLFDRVLNTNFFQAAAGGDVVSYQHIFWFYSHPAVYILMLPGFGIISEVISTHSRKPIFGYRLMALALLGIVVLGFSVWAHHMFVSGMWDWLRVPMMITTLLIAVPTGIKIFSWLATMYKGVVHMKSTGMLFSLGFIFTFVLGGISGVMLGMVPLDIHVSDTYFVVAHFHFVMFGGSVFTVFAGVYHWFPKMTGRMYDERLGRVHFWLTLAGMLGTFGPMHWIGMAGMPRRVADYAAEFAGWNLFISIAAFIMGLGQLIFLYNMVVSWAFGPKAPANPWRAKTIEWQVSSPPPTFNFDSIPRVVGGPYEYGVPGAQHAVMTADDRESGSHTEKVGPRRCAGRIGAMSAAAQEDVPRVLVFLNEVAAGRKLLSSVRSRIEQDENTRFFVVAPRNEPTVGHHVADRAEVERAAQSRVDVTLRVFEEFDIEADGRVLDADPMLALDDAVRNFGPDEIIISCLADSRYGLLRRDLITTAERRFDQPIEHVSVRIEDDALSWDVTHTLVVASQTVNSVTLVEELLEKVSKSTHRFTIVCPQGEGQAEEDRVALCERLARTLAILYRVDVAATGQPALSEPYDAIENAITYYSVDEILISTKEGSWSQWLEDGLVERVKQLTDKPVAHIESGSEEATMVAPSDDEPDTAAAAVGGQS